MAPFAIPVPLIVPLRLPVFGGSKSIDTNTKIELLCDTFLDHEIYYTLDGTRPQPYAGIVQGNKTIKYKTPFCLPPGKVTIKAIAVNAKIHTMCSNVVTKCFEVLKVKSAQTAKEKQAKDPKLKKQKVEDGSNKCHGNKEKTNDVLNNSFVSIPAESNGKNGNCFEEAFIDTLEFEMVDENVEDDADTHTQFLNATSDDEVSEESDILDEFDDPKLYAIADDMTLMDESIVASSKALEQQVENKKLDKRNGAVSANNQQNMETQICCLKCDITLQQCFSCKRMNAVASKFCIECGVQLAQICYSCKTHNPSVATFCQNCGKKLNVGVADEQLQAYMKVDSSVMAKPRLRHAGIQQLPVLVTKGTQTLSDGTPVKKSSPKFDIKRMPRHSPGRGYWHQQLDYICNHLKSHTYNNVEFRKTISEPILCDFKSAHIAKEENSVSVTVVFSPYDKSNLIQSEQVQSAGSS